MFDVSKSPNIGGLFENLKMLYPPKGSLLAASSRGPIVFTYVLSPEGTVQKQRTEGGLVVFYLFYFGLVKLYFSIYRRKFAKKNP